MTLMQNLRRLVVQKLGPSLKVEKHMQQIGDIHFSINILLYDFDTLKHVLLI